MPLMLSDEEKVLAFSSDFASMVDDFGERTSAPEKWPPSDLKKLVDYFVTVGGPYPEKPSFGPMDVPFEDERTPIVQRCVNRYVSMHAHRTIKARCNSRPVMPPGPPMSFSSPGLALAMSEGADPTPIANDSSQDPSLRLVPRFVDTSQGPSAGGLTTFLEAPRPVCGPGDADPSPPVNEVTAALAKLVWLKTVVKHLNPQMYEELKDAAWAEANRVLPPVSPVDGKVIVR